MGQIKGIFIFNKSAVQIFHLLHNFGIGVALETSSDLKNKNRPLAGSSPLKIQNRKSKIVNPKSKGPGGLT
jgi:hypothetical protein